jgi:hypothetical protein
MKVFVRLLQQNDVGIRTPQFRNDSFHGHAAGGHIARGEPERKCGGVMMMRPGKLESREYCSDHRRGDLAENQRPTSRVQRKEQEWDGGKSEYDPWNVQEYGRRPPALADEPQQCDRQHQTQGVHGAQGAERPEPRSFPWRCIAGHELRVGGNAIHLYPQLYRKMTMTNRLNRQRLPRGNFRPFRNSSFRPHFHFPE